MGESSACLVRSFSAGTSSEPKEVDPLRALTTSISFGRFMSESLDWEKWSCFPNNRYLEEAEKSSKPGSVAEKKAYFEAQYKRIAAKKAAALLEQQNTASNVYGLPEQDNVGKTPDISSMVSESSKSDGHVVIGGTYEKGAPNTEIGLSVDPNVGNPIVEEKKLETEEVEEAEIPLIEENSIQVELSNQHENVEKHSKIRSGRQETMPIMGVANRENLASTNSTKQSNSSLKSLTNIRASKLRSSVKVSPVQPSKEDTATQTSKKAARDVVEKKRSIPKSLHMSINFSSHASETRTTSQIIDKIGNSKMVRTFAKTSKDSSTPLRVPKRASVNGLSVNPSETTPPERRRTKTLDDCSGSRKRTAEGKSQSPSIDHLKPSGGSGHKTRPPMVPSSFSLRCEERAAKRKEFFQKLEEKLNADAETVHLQAKSKKKAEDDFKKVRQSTGFKAKPVANSHCEAESPNNLMKKIPLTRPRSPKLGRKAFPSMVQDTASQPRWRSSVNIDGSKHVIEKHIRTPYNSINSLLRKNIHENASPNIQP